MDTKIILDPNNPFRAMTTGWYVYEVLKGIKNPASTMSLAVEINLRYNFRIGEKNLPKLVKKVSFALWEMQKRKGVTLEVTSIGKEKQYRMNSRRGGNGKS